jgi:hypothetical protein
VFVILPLLSIVQISSFLYRITSPSAAFLDLPHRPFATTVSQLKICDFSGEMFKGFEVLHFSTSATTTQLLSSGEFCKLRYDTTPVKSASANVSFYTNNSKIMKYVIGRLTGLVTFCVETAFYNRFLKER